MLAQTRFSGFLYCQTSLKHSLPRRFMRSGRGDSTQHSPNFWEGLFAQILAGLVLAGTWFGKCWCGDREQKVVAPRALDGSAKAVISHSY